MNRLRSSCIQAIGARATRVHAAAARRARAAAARARFPVAVSGQAEMRRGQSF